MEGCQALALPREIPHTSFLEPVLAACSQAGNAIRLPDTALGMKVAGFRYLPCATHALPVQLLLWTKGQCQCAAPPAEAVMVESSPQSQDQQDLFERVLDQVNVATVKSFLANAKEVKPGDFGTTGNAEELIGHLRNAVNERSVTRAQVFSLLQEGEENGNQTILYYSPKSDAVRDLCSDPVEVARRLFGGTETTNFPRLPRLREGWEIVDFRTPYAGNARDWLMKVYTFQESKIQRESLDAEEVRFALKLKPHEYAVLFERRVIESVCIARWNWHQEHPLLELRIEIAGRLPRFRMDINALWTRLQPAVNQDDFNLWDLRKVLEKMLRVCTAHADVFQIGLVNLKDSGEGNVRYTPYTENEPIDTNQTRLTTIHQLLDDGGQCDRLVMNWMAAGSSGALESNLRTYAGSRGSNELVVRAQTTERAVNYVTDRLRHFAN